MVEREMEVIRPNFIVIGASRSGTTYIHDNLDSHPEIFVTKEPSEPHFFNKYYDKGLDHYLTYFAKAGHARAIGDVTPDYIFSSESAKRIQRDLPDVKILASLRNPIDRLYSMYWIQRDKYAENKSYSFEEMIEKRPDLIEQGFYADHLKPYFDRFDRKKIRILRFENIKDQSSEFLKSIYTFLEVDDSFESPYASTKINRARFLKHESRIKSLFYVWRLSKKIGLKHLAYTIEKLNSRPSPEMNQETRKKLVEIFRPKNDQLQELTGLDFTDWNN